MSEQTVRTSLDIPTRLHRRLREAAERNGCSTRQLILRSIERTVEELAPKDHKRRLSLEPPLVPADGRKPFNLNNEQLYDALEFP